VVGRNVLADASGPPGLVVSVRVRTADVREHRWRGVPYGMLASRRSARCQNLPTRWRNLFGRRGAFRRRSRAAASRRTQPSGEELLRVTPVGPARRPYPSYRARGSAGILRSCKNGVALGK
jgi:hypothetical protein